MKNLILSFLILIGFVSIATGQETDLKKIRGKAVSSLNIQYAKTYECKYKFGEPDTANKVQIFFTEYNRNGNVIQENQTPKRYDFMETLSVIYTYDSKNNVIADTTISNKGSKRVINKYINNFVVSRTFYSENESIRGKAIYKYLNGNMTEIVSYDSTGAVSYKTKFLYNSQNKLYQTNEYDKFGARDSYKKVILDTPTKTIEENYYKENEKQYTITYYKNQQGLTISSTLDWGEYKTKTTCKYKNDLLVETIEYDSNNEPEYYTFSEYIKFK